MSEPEIALRGTTTTHALIDYRREVADLQQRINNRRLQVIGLYGTPILALLTAVTWAVLKVFTWESRIPEAIVEVLAGTLALSGIATVVQLVVEYSEELALWRDRKTPLKKLKLELELAEERRILEARRLTPPTLERQASYKERMPWEVVRLRKESQRYRRQHLFMQWLLFVTSAAISGVTAWYDPPQPGKGILIGLSFTVTVITAASGYFKPRERAFNLQQTADSIEQHATALELGIAPYAHSDEKVNLESFASTVERVRAEQKMREQQLDQPQQGQQEVM